MFIFPFTTFVYLKRYLVSGRLVEQIVRDAVLISKELMEEEVLSISKMKPGAELIMNKLCRDACTIIGI